MNYKKLIKSRSMRIKILQFFKFVPDKQMISLQYYIKTGRKLNLKSPMRYTEKLQWYKLNYRDYKMIACVDKYDVRNYINSIGLGWSLTECYGIYDRVEDVDFNKLPDKFVIKDTLGGGGNSVIIVQDKSRLKLEPVINQMREWTSTPATYIDDGREWPYYYGKRHRIIIEEFLQSDSNEGLVDYKFFCFNGMVECVYVITDRELGKNISLGIFGRDFDKIDAYRMDENKLTKEFKKPQNFEKMIIVAETISKEFPHARIDLYNIKGRIVFGEITFYDGSGYMQFNPDAFDYILGKKFVLPEKFNNIKLRQGKED